MKLHEYQAKEIFRKHRISVPLSQVASSSQEALEFYNKKKLSKVVVKAQVLTGGRGKAGGIQTASSAPELDEKARSLLGSTLKTFQSGTKAHPVKKILVEAACDFKKELYLAVTVDRSLGLPKLIFSESGGMDIEAVAKKTPEKVTGIAFHPRGKIKSSIFEKGLRLSEGLEPCRSELAALSVTLADLFLQYDANLIEINPLAVMNDNTLTALDAKFVFDDNALFRHPEQARLKDPNEDDPKEMRAKKFSLSYVSLNGNVGCLVNGAGLAMSTMDVIKDAGGEPANFLDVGGGATKDQVLEGFRIILEDKNVKAVLVNIFGGIMKCDVIAQALLDAAGEIKIKVPVVIRLEGTRVEEGRALLKKSPIKLHTAKAMDEGAKLAVKLASS